MEIIRSARKTLSLEVKPDGSVLVRAPYGITDDEILIFTQKHKRWIEDKQKKAAERAREAVCGIRCERSYPVRRL